MMTMMTASARSLPMPRSDKSNEHRGAIEGPPVMAWTATSAAQASQCPRIDLIATLSCAASRQRWHHPDNKATASPSHRGRGELAGRPVRARVETRTEVIDALAAPGVVVTAAAPSRHEVSRAR